MANLFDCEACGDRTHPNDAYTIREYEHTGEQTHSHRVCRRCQDRFFRAGWIQIAQCSIPSTRQTWGSGR